MTKMKGACVSEEFILIVFGNVAIVNGLVVMENQGKLFHSNPVSLLIWSSALDCNILVLLFLGC